VCLRPFECIGELLSASSRFFDRLCQEENAALKHSQADLEYKLSQARFPPLPPAPPGLPTLPGGSVRHCTIRFSELPSLPICCSHFRNAAEKKLLVQANTHIKAMAKLRRELAAAEATVQEEVEAAVARKVSLKAASQPISGATTSAHLAVQLLVSSLTRN